VNTLQVQTERHKNPASKTNSVVSMNSLYNALIFYIHDSIWLRRTFPRRPLGFLFQFALQRHKPQLAWCNNLPWVIQQISCKFTFITRLMGIYTQVKKLSSPKPHGRLGGVDDCFSSLQPDTSLHCDTLDVGLVHHVVCLLTSQLLGQCHIILLGDRDI